MKTTRAVLIRHGGLSSGSLVRTEGRGRIGKNNDQEGKKSEFRGVLQSNDLDDM